MGVVEFFVCLGHPNFSTCILTYGQKQTVDSSRLVCFFPESRKIEKPSCFLPAFSGLQGHLPPHPCDGGHVVCDGDGEQEELSLSLQQHAPYRHAVVFIQSVDFSLHCLISNERMGSSLSKQTNKQTMLCQH